MGTHPIFESDFDCLTDHVSLESSRYLIRSLLVRRRQRHEKSAQARGGRTSRRRIGPECHLACLVKWQAGRRVQLWRQEARINAQKKETRLLNQSKSIRLLIYLLFQPRVKESA